MGIYFREYGVETTIDFVLFETDGVDFRVNAVHAAGDTKLMQDEGVEANTTNGFVDEGQGYSITLTAAEMQFARGVLYVVDQGAKQWLDRAFIIETYGSEGNSQHMINEAMLDTDLDTYQGKLRVTDDDGNTTDRYTIIWEKNGEPIEAGITNPTIQVYKRTDGTDLIAVSAMAQIGAKGTYKYDAVGAERFTDGAVYIARCQATIDGATRTWMEVISRDG